MSVSEHTKHQNTTAGSPKQNVIIVTNSTCAFLTLTGQNAMKRVNFAIAVGGFINSYRDKVLLNLLQFCIGYLTSIFSIVAETHGYLSI